jgi:hypothetical protein
LRRAFYARLETPPPSGVPRDTGAGSRHGLAWRLDRLDHRNFRWSGRESAFSLVEEGVLRPSRNPATVQRPPDTAARSRHHDTDHGSSDGV